MALSQHMFFESAAGNAFAGSSAAGVEMLELGGDMDHFILRLN